MTSALKIGCCGFPTAQLKYYAEFQLVEIQKTFYQLPQLSTAERWRTSAPQDFEFTLKAWQGVTHPAGSPTYRKTRLDIPAEKQKYLGHFQPTDEVHAAWRDTLQIVEILRAVAIVLQCPPGFTETAENIRNLSDFFRNAPRKDFKVAIEFRAPWQKMTIRDICRNFGLIHCVDPFKEAPLWGGIRYYRLHGAPPGKRMYHYQFQPTDFQLLATKISSDLENEQIVYCLFNNMQMWDDARTFKNHMGCE